MERDRTHPSQTCFQHHKKSFDMESLRQAEEADLGSLGAGTSKLIPTTWVTPGNSLRERPRTEASGELLMAAYAPRGRMGLKVNK